MFRLQYNQIQCEYKDLESQNVALIYNNECLKEKNLQIINAINEYDNNRLANNHLFKDLLEKAKEIKIKTLEKYDIQGYIDAIPYGENETKIKNLKDYMLR